MPAQALLSILDEDSMRNLFALLPLIGVAGIVFGVLTILHAAQRYEQLLRYELAGPREVVAALEATAGRRDLQECLVEAREEIDRLEIEVAWCTALQRQWPATAVL